MFNANDYTTEELVKMQLEEFANSEKFQEAVDFAVSLVENENYFVAEAARESTIQFELEVA